MNVAKKQGSIDGVLTECQACSFMTVSCNGSAVVLLRLSLAGPEANFVWKRRHLHRSLTNGQTLF